MFVLACIIIIALAQYLTNKILNISSDNKLSYTYNKRDTFIMLGFFITSIILQKVLPKGKVFWIGLGAYAASLLITMIILGTIKRIIVSKQREEIQSIFEVLEPVIPNEFKVKNKETGEFEMKDVNKTPFVLEYEGTKVNRITIKINPNTFKETVAVNLCLSLNKYLPTYEWVNEFDFAARTCSFVGTPLPPGVAKYQGSWLRPPEFIPIGLSGLGEVSWTLNSFKTGGRSNYVYEDGKIAKTVDTPSAPQALCVGSPLGLNTVVPTTRGYKTIETITVGDKVFGFDNKPVEVTEIYEINKKPEKIYLLTFSCAFYQISVLADSMHRFPVVDRVQTSINDNEFFHAVKCEELNIGQGIVGNKCDLILTKKKQLIKPQPVRCIKVNSDEHIFLITDVEHENWKGDQFYPYPAIYTYNTGGGKAIYINQEIDVINSDPVQS